MAVTYTDQEIESLVLEAKPLPADWRSRTRMVPKRGLSGGRPSALDERPGRLASD